MAARYRVAYLVSHPIQYQAPMLRYIAAHPEIDLTVFFLSDFSVREYKDDGFGAAVRWDVPLVDGYKHFFLPAFGGRDRLSALRPLSYGLTNHLCAGNFHALWLHGYAHQANLRAMMIAKQLGIKVFLRAESQLGSALRSRATRTTKEMALRWLFAKADAFLAIGTLNQQYYRHYGVPDDKIFSMPYAVDNDFFQRQAASARLHTEALRSELGLVSGRPVILYASKFVARKRAADLLEAYSRLSPDGEQEPNPYLLFVGDGEQRSELEVQAKTLGWSSVRFLGFKNQTELPAFFALCDVFVLVSEKEPWGLIVNEVMNAGKPVIVSDQVGAAHDLVQEGKNGYRVSVGDIEALATRLHTLTTNTDLAQRMGRKSLECIDRWGFCEDLSGLRAALEATASGSYPVKV